MPHRAQRKAHKPAHFIHGVPNRHLTEEEYRALSPERRKAVRDSGLWDVKSDAEMKGAAEKPATKEGDG